MIKFRLFAYFFFVRSANLSLSLLLISFWNWLFSALFCSCFENIIDSNWCLVWHMQNGMSRTTYTQCIHQTTGNSYRQGMWRKNFNAMSFTMASCWFLVLVFISFFVRISWRFTCEHQNSQWKPVKQFQKWNAVSNRTTSDERDRHCLSLTVMSTSSSQSTELTFYWRQTTTTTKTAPDMRCFLPSTLLLTKWIFDEKLKWIKVKQENDVEIILSQKVVNATGEWKMVWIWMKTTSVSISEVIFR